MKFCYSSYIIFAALLSPFVGLADKWMDPETGFTWTYRINEGRAELWNDWRAAISPYPNGEVAIPDTLGGVPVTSVGDGAFSYCEWLTSVTLPESIQNIGSRAFANCTRLIDVEIPSAVTNIGYWAFGECEELCSVSLSECLKYIDGYAFYGCRNLSNIEIPEAVTYIGEQVFYGCNDELFDTATISGLKMVDGWVVGIGGGVSANLDLTGARGIAACGLLGDNWERPNVKSIRIPGTFTIVPDNVCLGFDGLTNVIISAGVGRIGSGAFSGCTSLKCISLPPTVREIGQSAFNGCFSLEGITLPNSVERIDGYAFYYCTSLTNVVIGSVLSKVGAFAFACDEKLLSFSVSPENNHLVFENGLLINKIDHSVLVCPGGTVGEVWIPDGIQKIEQGAFVCCAGMTRVVVPSTITNIAEGVFAGCTALSAIHVDDNNHYITSDGILYDFDMRNLLACPGAKSGRIEIPTGVCSIGCEAFDGCSGLVKILMPESVTNIASGAFANCTGLTEMVIPDSVLSVGGRVLYGSTNIITVTIPQCIVNRENSVRDCLEVTDERHIIDLDYGQIIGIGSIVPNVILSCNVTNISDRAFYGCFGLKSVVLPHGITRLGEGVFAFCVDLENVTIPNSVTYIATGTSYTNNPPGAFQLCNSLKSLAVPQSICRDGLTSVFPQSIRNSLTNVVINSGVTRIEGEFFAEYGKLKSVTIPSSVTRLGDSVFQDCASLTDVYFDGDAPDMGINVFLGTPRSLVTHVNEGSIGWSDDFSDGLPSSWNGRRIAYVAGSGIGDPGASGDDLPSGYGSATSQVVLTVTNVVVHYILNSVVPENAVPVSGDIGFVTVVTEIKGGAVAIPEAWTANYPAFTEKFGNDLTAALVKPTGKKDAQGNSLFVWQDFVAGTDPTKVDDVFHATITMVDGAPHIGYTPELIAEEAAKRTYTIYGKAKLQDEEWSIVNGNESDYNFFKVTVEMRR